ncbi:S-adenosyl-L-methionine-dependent methyltransferase [Ampelomyces quisqualis]|uniref:tRNA wybutosine-synthesizing protein 2 n=1 Tax=Ampelomyces quisqualis TaxID=50730 RepID=A0A6A5QYB8_AMPQU|nr:S-adenosyl-L-methionine-dependent methyltransferase [Ampelomyces quisqualis]
MRIPTTIPYQVHDKSAHENTETMGLGLFHDLGLSHISGDISISYHTPPIDNATSTLKNPLHKALKAALDGLDTPVLTNLNLTSDILTTSFPEGYSIYPPLLLLPHNAFSSPPWTSLLALHPPQSPTLQPLWAHLATSMKTTHIAINSPIPLTQSTSSNTLRSPINLTPIHGSFGPPPTPQTLTSPTQHDFATALWVSTVQNGLHQTWAPLYTMFSRGNMREKTRLMHLPSATTPRRAAAAAVDMYAGIGYFAFPYRAAGLKPVVCFELNAWSVEGMRRGARRNGWRVEVHGPGDALGVGRAVAHAAVDFHVFHMSNVEAPACLARGPRIRHVNLGLLPCSRASWRDAVRLLDAEEGGWIHAHENVGVGEMRDRTVEIEGLFRAYVHELVGAGRMVGVEHVEKVKMYAPGVVHCVFDVKVGGKGANKGHQRDEENRSESVAS